MISFHFPNIVTRFPNIFTMSTSPYILNFPKGSKGRNIFLPLHPTFMLIFPIFCLLIGMVFHLTKKPYLSNIAMALKLTGFNLSLTHLFLTLVCHCAAVWKEGHKSKVLHWRIQVQGTLLHHRGCIYMRCYVTISISYITIALLGTNCDSATTA